MPTATTILHQLISESSGASGRSSMRSSRPPVNPCSRLISEKASSDQCSPNISRLAHSVPNRQAASMSAREGPRQRKTATVIMADAYQIGEILLPNAASSRQNSEARKHSRPSSSAGLKENGAFCAGEKVSVVIHESGLPANDG